MNKHMQPEEADVENVFSSSSSPHSPVDLTHYSSKFISNYLPQNKKVNAITNQLLNSTCDLLVNKACNGKRKLN